MLAKDWTVLFTKYKGQWVALKDDEITVVAHGNNASQVWEKATALVKKPILLQVPSDLLPYVG